MKDLKPVAIVPNEPGRPRSVCGKGESGSVVSAYLPSAYHDRLVQLANQRDQSVSSLVRSLLILRLR